MDIVKTNQWLKRAGLKAETEGLIIAAQDLSLPTRNYQANIFLKNPDQTQYVDCVNKKNESIEHLMSNCCTLTAIEYEEMHDKRGHYIYLKVSKYYGILDCEKWEKHQPKPITESKGATILWEFTIQTYKKKNKEE